MIIPLFHTPGVTRSLLSAWHAPSSAWCIPIHLSKASSRSPLVFYDTFLDPMLTRFNHCRLVQAQLFCHIHHFSLPCSLCVHLTWRAGSMPNWTFTYRTWHLGGAQYIFMALRETDHWSTFGEDQVER